MNQSDLITWLQENLQRLKQTQPKFWKVWSAINGIILFLAGLPTIMAWIDVPDLNQFLPGTVVRVILKIISFCAAYGLFLNKLTVKGTHEVVSEGDTLLSKPCPDLPYTEKKEGMKIIDVKQTIS